MSREELVTAFLEGRLSRRTLIRRLVAGGVSVGAAVSYAQMLSPERASAQSARVSEDLYPLVQMTMVSSDLDVVIANGVVRVNVTSTEEIGTAQFRAFLQRSVGLETLGRRNYSNFLDGAGQREAVIHIDPAPLEPRQKARIRVDVSAADSANHFSLAVVQKLISR